MKNKVLILILPSFFKFLIFPSIFLIQHIWTFFIKVFSETTWSRIMKSLTILSFLWKCYNLWWLPPGVCELCSLLAIFITVPWSHFFCTTILSPLCPHLIITVPWSHFFCTTILFPLYPHLIITVPWSHYFCTTILFLFQKEAGALRMRKRMSYKVNFFLILPCWIFYICPVKDFFYWKFVIIFLPINLNMCFGCS